FAKDLVKFRRCSMGGYGSGPSDNKLDTSEAKRVDVRYMRRHKLLRPGFSGLLSWTRGGKPNGNIGYSVKHDSSAIILDYKISEKGGEWQPMTITVPLEVTPCRYGGARQYFQCPNLRCRRRCEVLYSCG